MELSFHQFLEDELALRCKKNPSYSLRSFAKFLGIDPSLLSKILNKKKKLTSNFIKSAGEKLGIANEKIHFYRLYHEAKSIKTYEKFDSLNLEEYLIISKWYHFAIMELVRLNSFEFTNDWIADKLKISTCEVEKALERLERLKYLNINSEGKVSEVVPQKSTLAISDTHKALREMQNDLLLKSIESLNTVNSSERDHSGITMAIDSSLIPVAKEKIKNFRRELCELLESTESKDQVYQLSISLFPLTQNGCQP